MYILNDLWNGSITPNERYIRSGSEYQKTAEEYCKEIELFIKDLSPEKRRHYEELEKLQTRLVSISDEDIFIVGFRMGARMIMDVIGDYSGQFQFPADI